MITWISIISYHSCRLFVGFALLQQDSFTLVGLRWSHLLDQCRNLTQCLLIARFGNNLSICIDLRINNIWQLVFDRVRVAKVEFKRFPANRSSITDTNQTKLFLKPVLAQ